MYNLKQRKIGDFISNGMVMFACSDDHKSFNQIAPPEGSKLGERIFFEGHEYSENNVPPLINRKKKLLEKCFPFLVTNEKLECTFKGAKMMTSAGVVKVSDLKNCHIS